MSTLNSPRAVLFPLLAAVALLANAPASADVVYLSRDSQVRLNLCNESFQCSVVGQAHATDFAPFSASFTSSAGHEVMQNSVLGSNGISVSMLGTKTFGIVDSALSSFSTQFELTSAMAFDLLASIQHNFYSRTFNFSLTGPGTSISAQYLRGDTSYEYWGADLQGILLPGIYTLAMSINADASRFNIVEQGSLNLELTPVPLPAAVLSLLPALAGFGLWRRKAVKKAA